ncbi:Rhs family protein, partial [Pseudomonas syringae pv. actinidiae ICMP 19099]
MASYKYDAFGRRIEKTVDGHTTEFLWQGERLIAESAANRYRTYIYEPGTFRPLAMLKRGFVQVRRLRKTHRKDRRWPHHR